MQHSVREATFEDMPLVAEIMVTSFRTAFAGLVTPETMAACTNPENCRAMMQHVYREGRMRFLLGDDAGFLCWCRTEQGAEIIALHSLPKSWGTGLGRAMMEKALSQMEGTAELWVFRDNLRARRFYEKQGFSWDGRERISKFDDAAEVHYVRGQEKET